MSVGIGSGSRAGVPLSRRPLRADAGPRRTLAHPRIWLAPWTVRCGIFSRALAMARKEAEKADRPPFHVLRNEELLKAAVKFASGSVPDYKHFSFRRRQAFLDAAQAALRAPESEWPVSRRRFGTRPTQ